jgi:hypothetical protein
MPGLIRLDVLEHFKDSLALTEAQTVTLSGDSWWGNPITATTLGFDSKPLLSKVTGHWKPLPGLPVADEGTPD